MIGIRIENGFLDLSNTKFSCPSCKKQYEDENDKYLERCNKNKNFTTFLKCNCGCRFNLTFNTFGDFVTFL